MSPWRGRVAVLLERANGWFAEYRDNDINGLSLRLQKGVAARVEKNRPGNAWPLTAPRP
jgi:hypothetical protein